MHSHHSGSSEEEFRLMEFLLRDPYDSENGLRISNIRNIEQYHVTNAVVVAVPGLWSLGPHPFR